MRRPPARLAILLGVAALLAACAHAPSRRPGTAAQIIPPHDDAALLKTPDAVPHVEPRSPYGNPPSYTVYGHRYVVLATADGYFARGMASWYGPTFQGERTSSGEIYDMFGMTAAQKTLPLPCYARVTNLSNGRSVVVRINDRGPFVGDRLIDLSYTAALKLDMIRTGTALVEVQTINPTIPLAPAPPVNPVTPLPAAAPLQVAPLTAKTSSPGEPGTAAGPDPGSVSPATAGPGSVANSTAAAGMSALMAANTAAPAAAPAAAFTGSPVPTAIPAPAPAAARALFIQVGAYSNSDNARRAAHKLRAAGLGQVFTLLPSTGQSLLRVRIGPVADLQEFDTLIARLVQLGFGDARLAQE